MIYHFNQHREEILSKTLLSEDLEATTIVSCVPAKKSQLSDALDKIRNQTAKQNKHQRNLTFRTVASTPKARGNDLAQSREFSPPSRQIEVHNSAMFSQIDVKPRLLESRVIEDEKFLHLSDGFKRVFSNEREDKNIILPIAGYGGHRRGDRSQNFFGRPFRDISIQSKRLQRQLQMGNSPVAADL